MRFFDPYLRKNSLSYQKENAWIRDQYEHPVERKHSIDQVLAWFDANDVEFIGSLPNCNLDERYMGLAGMTGERATFFQRYIAQLLMIFSTYGNEGGLFLMIGRKGSQPDTN